MKEDIDYRHTQVEDSVYELKQGIHAALETYSNVHRGKGHNSIVSTHLFEKARGIVLDYLELEKKIFVVIFCSPRSAETLESLLEPESYKCISSLEIGMSLGVRALAVKKKALPAGSPFNTGGGTTKLVSRNWIIWADAPDRFEAGTPSIVNIITFAKALLLIHKSGIDTFRNTVTAKLKSDEILFRDSLENYSGLELLNELRKTHIGRGVNVPTTYGIKSYTNLDNAASTPTFEPVWEAASMAWCLPIQEQQDMIQKVIAICADFLSAPQADYDYIFTSNATEAINLVAESLDNNYGDGTEHVVVNTILEHNSNDLPWRMVPGCTLIRLSVNNEGFVDLNELEKLLCDYNEKCLFGKKRIRLVAITGASNVIGVFNDLTAISSIVHKYSAHLLVDGAQLVAHRRTDIKGSGIDYLAFSGHKIYAPFGSGLLVALKGLLKFSTSELDLIKSSGEENVSGIAALGKAIILLRRIGLDNIQNAEHELIVRTIRGLSQISGLRIFGTCDPDSHMIKQRGGVISFEIKGFFAHDIAKRLATDGGIGVRSGCHCAHVLVKHLLKVPPALEKFQKVIVTLFPAISLPGIARVSLGIENTEVDIEKLIHELSKIAAKQKASEGIVSSLKEVQKQIDEFIKSAEKRVYDEQLV